MSRMNDQIRTGVDYWALVVYQDEPVTFSVTADEQTLTQSRYCRYNFNLPARSCSTGNIYLARQVKVKWDALDMLITFEFAWEWIFEKLSGTVTAISLSHGFCHLSMLARVKPNLVERKKKYACWASDTLQFEELRVLCVSLRKGTSFSAAWRQQSLAETQD